METAYKRSSLLFYRAVRGLIRSVLFRWLKVQATGTEHLDQEGPIILAPVHRSNLDSLIMAGLSDRRLRALGKISLFKNPIFAWVVAALGAVPLKRGEADRDALRSARTMLDAGEELIVFPEGTRQEGPTVAEIFDGPAYLAVKTGAVIVPVGIAGTDRAMPPGARIPKRVRVGVVVGEPIVPESGRVSRPRLAAMSEELTARLQSALDEAHRLIQ